MKISVTRSGGFAGISEEIASVDTTRLERTLGQRLEQMVRDARFFELPDHLPASDVGADRFRYEVTVTDGVRRHSVTYEDDSPRSLPVRRLVEALTGPG